MIVRCFMRLVDDFVNRIESEDVWIWQQWWRILISAFQNCPTGWDHSKDMKKEPPVGIEILGSWTQARGKNYRSGPWPAIVCECLYLMCRVWQALGAHEIIFKVNDMPQFWLKSGLDPKLWWWYHLFSWGRGDLPPGFGGLQGGTLHDPPPAWDWYPCGHRGDDPPRGGLPWVQATCGEAHSGGATRCCIPLLDASCGGVAFPVCGPNHIRCCWVAAFSQDALLWPSMCTLRSASRWVQVPLAWAVE